MSANVKASKKLQDLIDEMVKLSSDEGLTVTEMNNLIKQARQKIDYTTTIPATRDLYRKPTEEELTFKDKCFEFFSRELTAYDITSSYSKNLGHTNSNESYQKSLLLFSEIMCAAKMLLTDGMKINNTNIRDILYSHFPRASYNELVSIIGYEVQALREAAHTKEKAGSWKYFFVGFKSSHSSATIHGYLGFLADNGIQ